MKSIDIIWNSLKSLKILKNPLNSPKIPLIPKNPLQSLEILKGPQYPLKSIWDPLKSLRGGVKLENRENLGQCPYHGWPSPLRHLGHFWISDIFEKCWPPPPSYQIGTFLNFRHFWKMLTPPPLTKLGHFWISDISYKGNIAKYTIK